MGAAARGSPTASLVTSDNPRGEDPLAIIDADRAGASRRLRESSPTAPRAIEAAIARRARADVVLIAGKGHEDYQEIAGKRLPFSDARRRGAALAHAERAR